MKIVYYYIGREYIRNIEKYGLLLEGRIGYKIIKNGSVSY
jgi:hypothetical protein